MSEEYQGIIVELALLRETYSALRAAFAVLKELQECSSYWSEYYVPIGIHERIADAVRNVEALDSGGGDE